MRAMTILTGLVSVMVMLPASALAQAGTAAAADLPEASLLRERHIEGVGGRAALEQYQSSHALGTFEIPGQGIHGSLEVFAAAPNNLLVTIDIPGIGTVRTGYDGEVGWTIHPATGPMVMEGRQLDQIRQQADFIGVLHPERYIASTETVEETEFAGRPTYKVRVVTLWDEEYFEFFDKETGLLRTTGTSVASTLHPKWSNACWVRSSCSSSTKWSTIRWTGPCSSYRMRSGPSCPSRERAGSTEAAWWVGALAHVHERVSGAGSLRGPNQYASR